MPRIIKGKIKEIICSLVICKVKATSQSPVTLSLIAMTAIIKPKNVDPASPKNIEAGLKLYFKNPKHDPIMIIEMIARSVCPLLSANKKKKNDAIAETPLTKPSIPSSIFMELVIKVMKLMESNRLIQFVLKN